MVVKRAEIAGGGIGGLTASVLLARMGWEVRVHEQSPELREIGAGVFIKHNSQTVLDRMGLLSRIRDEGARIGRARMFDARGRLLQERTLTGDREIVNVLRQSLLKALSEAAIDAGVNIETGSRAVGATPQGELLLATGNAVSADLVIAADGHRSRVRESLGLTRRFRTLNAGATRFLIPRGASEEVAEQREYWSGRRRAGITPCSAIQSYVYLASRNDDSAGVCVPPDFASWRLSFPTLERELSGADTTEATRTPYTLVSVSSWRRGRAVLLGDAAHALPPTLGQGAGMTMMNAWALASALRDEPNVERGLHLWESRQRPLVERTQLWATRYNWLSDSIPDSMAGLRSTLIHVLGAVPSVNRHMRAVDSWSAWS